jgi:uncharacterized protein (TIGR03086 family)
LLQLLGHGEQTVTELASNFMVSRSAISQHLAVLAEAGLVASRREGRFQHYRLRPEGITALRAELDSFWTRELDQLVRDAITGGSAMPFEKSVLVPLSADETFALITEPGRLRRWQAITARVDLRAGGEYRWTITPGHSACGTFTEVEPGRRVVFTWGWEGDTGLPPGASTVSITLEPTAGGTLVRLVHDGLTGEQAVSHGAGWTHYLGRLVVAATQGDAGSDEWAAGRGDLDAITAAEATLAVCQRVLREVADSDYGTATVCPEFTVTQLADHLTRSVTLVGGAAGATFPPAPASTIEARVAAAAQPALEAWNARGLSGTVQLGPGEMPAEAALGILSIEFLVHAWDFAQATGQQVTVSEDLAGHVLGVAGQIITPEARGRGSFADAVLTGPDANVMDRLIAFTGRNVPAGGNATAT